MCDCILEPFSKADLDLLKQEDWTHKEWLFWTGHRFSFPMVKEEFFTHIKEEGRTWWLLKKGNKFIGVGELKNKDNNKIKLSRIYIFKAYRQRAYAKILLELLMEKANTLYSNPLFFLNVFLENKIAIHLYENLGFKEVVGQRKNIAFEGEDLILIQMQKV